jgi:hypothetical protein
MITFSGYGHWMTGQAIQWDVRRDCEGQRDPLLAEIEERLG